MAIAEAYTSDNLQQLIESNEHGPEVDAEMVERIIEVASQHAETRGLMGEDGGDEYLVFAEWDNFNRDTFGSDGGEPRRFAICTIDLDVSQTRQAWLCKRAAAIGQKWLKSGDGRRTKLEQIDQSDTEYVDDVGVFWCPKEYTGTIRLSQELLDVTVNAGDAM